MGQSFRPADVGLLSRTTNASNPAPPPRTGAVSGVSGVVAQLAQASAEALQAINTTQGVADSILLFPGRETRLDVFVEGEHVRIRPGGPCGLMIRAGQLTRFVGHAERAPALHLLVPVARAADIRNQTGIDSAPPPVASFTADSRPARLMHDLLARMTEGRALTPLSVDSYANLIVEAVSQQSPQTSLRGTLAPWQLRRVVEYIESHLADEVALAHLASLVSLSPFHFARGFKASSGVPPHRYLIERRMERAKQLLDSTTRPISEIAVLVGYDDPSYFARLFAREIGMPPGAYRRGG